MIKSSRHFLSKKGFLFHEEVNVANQSYYGKKTSVSIGFWINGYLNSPWTSALSQDDNAKVICGAGAAKVKIWRFVLVVLGAPRAPRILLTSTIFVLHNWLKDQATMFTHSLKNLNYRPNERKMDHHVAATVCSLVRGQTIFLKHWDDSDSSDHLNTSEIRLKSG